jgi:zinc protease
MDNSDSIAGILARFVALRRTPESMNRFYDMFAKITPEDVQQAAKQYLVESGRTIVTLTGKAPGGGN